MVLDPDFLRNPILVEVNEMSSQIADTVDEIIKKEIDLDLKSISRSFPCLPIIHANFPDGRPRVVARRIRHRHVDRGTGAVYHTAKPCLVSFESADFALSRETELLLPLFDKRPFVVYENFAYEFGFPDTGNFAEKWFRRRPIDAREGHNLLNVEKRSFSTFDFVVDSLPPFESL
jgi:hypothetical protein